MFGHAEQYPDENNADDEEDENGHVNYWKVLLEFWKKIDLRLVYFFYFLQLLDNFY